MLLQEAVDALAIRTDGIYIDATFGAGGHTRAILSQLSPQGRLFALDCDPAVESVAAKLAPRCQFQCRSFIQLLDFARECEIAGRVDGLLLDLGISSTQLDDPARGFSFMKDGALDMRMNPAVGESVCEWINRVSAAEIETVLRSFGEEPRARQISNRIVAERRQGPLKNTRQLAELVASLVPRSKGRHPATRTFQALRIHINNELEALRDVLQQSLEVLAAGGRLVVISFHSLEDRIVKRFFRDHSGRAPRDGNLPLREMQSPEPLLKPVGGLVRPGVQELRDNRRARSARLRVVERTAG